MLNTESLLKEANAYYDIFSRPINLRCPFCKFEAKGKTKRTRTYHSLKSLSWHLVHFHSNAVGYPFTIEQTQEVIRAIGIAIHWEVLV